MEDNREKDTRYNLIAGGLLVLIIALLAVLWIRERRDRVYYFTQASQLQTQYAQMQDAVKSFALRDMQRNRPLGADDVVQVYDGVQIGDRKAKVLVITSQAGEARGIGPGQTLSVPPAPSTQPADK